jgi:hypothetical protein
MLMTVAFPVEPFNSLVREGRAGAVIGEILGELKPEAAYFTAVDGMRAGHLILNLTEASEMPRYAEPFFLHFNAKCEMTPVMVPADLQKAGLEELGKKWG